MARTPAQRRHRDPFRRHILGTSLPPPLLLPRCPECEHLRVLHVSDGGPGTPGCHRKGCTCTLTPEQIERRGEEEA